MRTRNMVPVKLAVRQLRQVFVVSVSNLNGGHVHLGLAGPSTVWFSVLRTQEMAETDVCLVAVRMGAAPPTSQFDGIVAVRLGYGDAEMSGPFNTRLSVNGKEPDLYWAAWDRGGAAAQYPNVLNKLVVYVEEV